MKNTKQKPDRFTVPKKGIGVKPMTQKQKKTIEEINKELKKQKGGK